MFRFLPFIFFASIISERKVSEKAFEIHGYSDEFLATKQKFADIADDFIDFKVKRSYDEAILNIKPNIDLSEESSAFIRWLRSGYAGDMTYLKRNIKKRLHPELLVPETHRVISVTMDYLPPNTDPKKNTKR